MRISLPLLAAYQYMLMYATYISDFCSGKNNLQGNFWEGQTHNMHLDFFRIVLKQPKYIISKNGFLYQRGNSVVLV